MATAQNPYLLVAPASDGHEGGIRDDFEVVKHGLTLSEYQLYAVEQWVVDRSRTSSTFVVSTNDASHKIAVDIFTPRTESADLRAALWDRALQKARTSGARPKQTHLGFVFVVSLLGFRSDLSIVLIPDGDFGNARDALYTNINLRRLGCGGRSGLSLSEPSPSQQERLLQAYRLPSSGTFTLTLLSMVKLVQAALALFNMGPLNGKLRVLSEPDGLICDSTVAGLAAWQIEVAEPLLEADLGETILSPSALAALLSMVMSVRCRLLAMGISNVPSDPFEDRTAFLRCYDTYMRSTRNAPESQYLSAAGIHHLKQQYTRTTRESFKRAIRHRLDDIRGGDGAGHSKSGFFEDEIVDINSFVLAVQNYGHNDMSSVTDLWKGRLRKGKHTTRKSSSKEEDSPTHPRILVTDDEDESGLGSKLLKGVSKQTKRIGGGVTGLLDKASGRSGHDMDGQDDTVRLRKSHASSALGRSYDNMSALLQEPPLNESVGRFSPFQSVLSLGRSPSPAGTRMERQDTQNTNLLLVRPVNMRRAATETNIAPTSEDPQEPKNAVLNETRWRRHSFNCQRDGPAPKQIMSARRMKMDVDIYTSYYELRKRETQLAKLVKTLTALDSAYTKALAKITPSIRQRGQTVSELSHRSVQLQQEIETFTDAATRKTNTHAKRELSLDSNNQSYVTAEEELDISVVDAADHLKYALNGIDEKVQELQGADRVLLTKIGGSEVLFDKGVVRRWEEAPGVLIRDLGRLAESPPGWKWIRGVMYLYETVCGRFSLVSKR